MAIEDFTCDDCDKYTCCKFVDLLLKFDEDAKKPVPINIRFLDCKEFKKVEDR